MTLLRYLIVLQLYSQGHYILHVLGLSQYFVRYNYFFTNKMGLSRLGIIPCRMASQRFPGKPLAPILGATMLERVYRAACKSKLLEAVWIATGTYFLHL